MEYRYTAIQRTLFRTMIRRESHVAVKMYVPQKGPVYLKASRICNVSLQFENQMKKGHSRKVLLLNPRLVFCTRTPLMSVEKNRVLPKHKSLSIYEFLFRCDAKYVGRTSRKLKNMIKRPLNVKQQNVQQREQPPRSSKKNNPTTLSITRAMFNS